MFTIASSTAALSTAYTDIGTVIAVAVAAVLVAWAALVGLGFGVRKASRYVTGRKF